jgi:hypothetical protein
MLTFSGIKSGSGSLIGLNNHRCRIVDCTIVVRVGLESGQELVARARQAKEMRGLHVDLIIQMVNTSHPAIEKTRCGSLNRSSAGSLPVVRV